MINLMHGDCLELMKTIPDGSVDMVLTDPPYGTTACKWDSVIPFEPMWDQLKRIIKPNGAIVLFGSEPFSSALRMSNIKQYKYDWVWDKVSGGAFVLAKVRPMQTVENICVFGCGKVNYYPQMTDADEKNIRPISSPTKPKELLPVRGSGLVRSSENYNNKKRYPKNLIKFNKGNAECNSLNRLHPTQKPVALLEYLIKTYTKEGEAVLDFTMGSGSTGVAAKNLNRSFIGIEMDDKYFEIAKERINGNP